MNKLLIPIVIVAISLILVACSGTTGRQEYKELSTSEIVEMVSPAVVYIENSYGIGTGTVIDVRGYVLTNNHVVEEEDYALVRLPGKQDVIAEVVYRDVSLDIAILKCSGTGYPHIALGSVVESDLGDDATAFGHTVGEGESVSISKGIISSFRTFEGIEYIQTDAAANPGSSGGPLINSYGEFIGIVTWGLAETEGINFAIDVNSIKTSMEIILQQLVQGSISTKTDTLAETTTKTKTVTVTSTTTVGAGQTKTVTATVTTTVAAGQIATVTATVTTTVGAGQTATVTETQTTSRFVCPIDGIEFGTWAELIAHFQSEHSSGAPSPTVTVTPSPTTTTVTPTPTTTTITTTVTVTTTPPPTTIATPTTIFSHSGSGRVNTPSFSIDTSPWILRFSANGSGLLGVLLKNGSGSERVIWQNVVAGEIYETYIYEQTGNNLYFELDRADFSGEWTLSVIKLS